MESRTCEHTGLACYVCPRSCVIEACRGARAAIDECLSPHFHDWRATIDRDDEPMLVCACGTERTCPVLDAIYGNRWLWNQIRDHEEALAVKARREGRAT